MRRLMSWSLVLMVACVAVFPLTGCGSKKAPATIAELLAKAKTNPKPEYLKMLLLVRAAISSAMTAKKAP